MNIYFAYGSNLSRSQMKERCPGSTAIEVGCLENHKLAFTKYSKTRKGGVADVVSFEGNRVWGLLWELSDKNLSRLDKFEGYPKFYDRVPMKIRKNDSYLKAWVYVVVNKVSHVQPHPDYLKIIMDEGENLKFPQEYLDQIHKFRVYAVTKCRRSPKRGNATRKKPIT